MLPRLKTAPQFAAVLNASRLNAQGHGTWRSKHFALHLSPIAAMDSVKTKVQQTQTIVGVICPKRWAKRAVTRNTIKRQIYAVTQRLAPELPLACVVLRLTAEFSREQFSSATSPALKRALCTELATLLRKIVRSEQT